MDIKISKAGYCCFGCEKDFAHEQTVHSLTRAVDGSLQREDYCAQCWPQASRTASYCAWSTQYYDPKVAEQQPPETFSPLRQLFYEAVESDTRLDMAQAYLAAQLLRRQKVFRLIKESADGETEGIRIALFSDRIGDRLIEVCDPDLSHAEMEAGRQALVVRLNELENPEPPEEIEPFESNAPEQTQAGTTG